MNEIIFIITLVLPALAYLGIGITIVKSISKLFNFNISNTNYYLSSFLWSLGAMSHIFLSYLIYRSGLNIQVSFWITLAFLVVFSNKDLVNVQTIFRAIQSSRPNISSILFFLITFVLGLTLFDINNGIKTIWVNNYADLPFHLGIISNFVFGNKPLTEYHVFPGQPFSYTVLFNFWTACLWSSLPEYKYLDLIFLIQWVIVWFFVYQGLTNNRRNYNDVLPWLILLAGSTYPLLLSNINIGFSSVPKGFSHTGIETGYPITSLLSTIWIPQRSSLIGLGIAAVCLSQFFSSMNVAKNFLINQKEYAISLVSISLLLGISLLAHFHILLAVFLSLSIILLWDFIEKIFYTKKFPLAEPSFVLTFIISAIIPLRILSGKTNIIEFIDGWMTKDPFSFYDLSLMWITNLSLLGLVFIYFLYKLPKRYALSVVILFIIGNVLKLSSWEWDNYKFFIGAFVVLVFYTSYFVRLSKYLELIVVISILPGIYEASKIFLSETLTTIYSEEDLYLASQIRTTTPADSIIAGVPDHNSAITLAGRRIFMGYEGWLSSHSIDYKERQYMNTNLNVLVNCLSRYNKEICPTYYLSSSPSLESGYLERTEVPRLYKISLK